MPRRQSRRYHTRLRPASGAGASARSEVHGTMGTLWSIAAVLAVTLLAVVVLVACSLLRRRRRPQPLPTEGSLSARPVFSADERRVYKLLREALPHHIVLSKLPFVRFSAPSAATGGRLVVS